MDVSLVGVGGALRERRGLVRARGVALRRALMAAPRTVRCRLRCGGSSSGIRRALASWMNTGLALGIVFAMTDKPAFAGSVAALVVGAAAGLAVAVGASGGGMPSAVVLGARNLGGAIARGLLADGYRVASVARTDADLDGARGRGAVGGARRTPPTRRRSAAFARAAREDRVGPPDVARQRGVACARPTMVGRSAAARSRRVAGGVRRVGGSRRRGRRFSSSPRAHVRSPDGRDARAGDGRAGTAGGAGARSRRSGPGGACARSPTRQRWSTRRRRAREAADRRRDHRVAEDDADDGGDAARRTRAARTTSSRGAVSGEPVDPRLSHELVLTPAGGRGCRELPLT